MSLTYSALLLSFTLFSGGLLYVFLNTVYLLFKNGYVFFGKLLLLPVVFILLIYFFENSLTSLSVYFFDTSVYVYDAFFLSFVALVFLTFIGLIKLKNRVLLVIFCFSAIAAIINWISIILGVLNRLL